METSRAIRAFLAAAGRKGGKARAQRLGPDRRAASARRAALGRWMRTRFGTGAFVEMGLPGAEMVDRGLAELADGVVDSPDALTVAEASPRLRFLGVPVPATARKLDHARETLYRRLEASEGDMAHARFLAILAMIDSFCDALASVRTRAVHSMHRKRRWVR